MLNRPFVNITWVEISVKLRKQKKILNQLKILSLYKLCESKYKYCVACFRLEPPRLAWLCMCRWWRKERAGLDDQNMLRDELLIMSTTKWLVPCLPAWWSPLTRQSVSQDEVRLVSWAGSSKGFTSCTPAARSSTSNRVYYQQHSLLEAADIVLEHLLSSPPGVHVVSRAGRGCTPRGWERARLARSPQLWAGYLCPGVFTQELTCNKQWKEELELLALTNG